MTDEPFRKCKCGEPIEPCEGCNVIWGKDAERFIENLKNPKPNPARDKTIKRAKELKIKIG